MTDPDIARSENRRPPDAELARSQLTKRRLEIATLERQGRWTAQLPQYLAAITALTTVIGIGLGVATFYWNRSKDSEERQREANERADLRYQSDAEQLSKFSSDPAVTVPHVFLLRDLLHVTETSAQRRAEATELLQAIGSLWSLLVHRLSSMSSEVAPEPAGAQAAPAPAGTASSSPPPS